MKSALPLAALLPLVALACNGSTSEGPSGTPPADGTIPCDVDALLAQSCRQCHGASPQFGAPMPLVTYADLHAAAKSDGSRKVYELAAARIHDDLKPMPPPPNARLSAEDAAAIDDWVAAGAPSGSGSCGAGGGGGTGGGGPMLGCTPDITLQPETAWVMPKDVEDVYVCYGVDVPIEGKRHLIGLAPHIDNSTIVHHILLYLADASYPSTPAPCGAADKGRLMGVWAPGGQAIELPPEAGFPLEGTAHFVFQIHYSNLMALEGEEDRSGYQLCTTSDLRANDADILAFGTNSINIPAHSSVDITCSLNVPAIMPTINAMWGMPHMHKIGTAISTTLQPGGSGELVDLGTADPWDFQNQIWVPLSTQIQPGDVVRTRCAWDNPGSTTVGFGEETSDEMCFSFVMFYPKIEASLWHWAAPAVGSTCSPTSP